MLGARDRLAAGCRLAAGPGLKLGVALLGAQVVWADVLHLGLPVIGASAAIVSLGVAIGAGLGVALGLPLVEALIAACAMSICGASAAMATASALPQSPSSRQTTVLVVVAANLLSTVAMVAYPLLSTAMSMSNRQAGVFFGLSIQDVAQVAAAGAAVSPAATATAALTKVTRILWLGPAIMLASTMSSRFAGQGASTRLRLTPPPVVIGFFAVMLASNLGAVPTGSVELLSHLSHLLLLAGVAAISSQLPLKALTKVRPSLIASMVILSVLVAGTAAAVSLLLVR
jgi:uncharacterized integral membrane protein (TIGR00698 family)